MYRSSDSSSNPIPAKTEVLKHAGLMEHILASACGSGMVASVSRRCLHIYRAGDENKQLRTRLNEACSTPTTLQYGLQYGLANPHRHKEGQIFLLDEPDDTDTEECAYVRGCRDKLNHQDPKDHNPVPCCADGSCTYRWDCTMMCSLVASYGSLESLVFIITQRTQLFGIEARTALRCFRSRYRISARAVQHADIDRWPGCMSITY